MVRATMFAPVTHRPTGRYSVLVTVGLGSAVLLTAALATVSTVGPRHPGPSLVEVGDAAPVVKFPVNFSVTGIPAGTPWNLTLPGQTWSATSSWIVINEPNGSYPYSASSPNYPGNRFANGTVMVAGKPVSVLLTWSGARPPSASNGTASSALFGIGRASYILVAALVVVVGVGVALASVARRATVAARGSARTDEVPLGAPGAERTQEVEASSSPEDPLRHML